MKIAVLAYSTSDCYGTCAVALQQAAFFTKAGCDVTFFTLCPSDDLLDIPVKTLQPPLTRQVLLRPWFTLFTLLPSPLHLPLMHKCIKPLSAFDAVIAYDYPFSWWGHYAKKMYGVKYCLYLQGLALPEASDCAWRKALLQMETHGMIRPSTTSADIVATETSLMQETLKHKFEIDSMVVQNPTHLSLDSSATGDEVRRRHGISDEPLILFVDRLSSEKDIETLLRAFHIIRNKIPEAKLMLIGKCDQDSYMRKIQALSDDSVIIIDYVPHSEIKAYYSACTIFATCAMWEEGFSHTILEAQSCAKPVVAFNVGAHKEVIIDGETGILVNDVGNEYNFASALLRVMCDKELAHTMSGKAVEWSRQLAEKGHHNYQKLLGKLTD